MNFVSNGKIRIQKVYPEESQSERVAVTVEMPHCCEGGKHTLHSQYRVTRVTYRNTISIFVMISNHGWS